MPIPEDKDISLPKATLSKIIRENIPKDLRIAGDTMQMLHECSTEFVKLLSSEANDKSSEERMSTINPEHVMSALHSLGFDSFIPEVQEAWDAWKDENKAKAASSKGSKAKTAADIAGYSEEEQIKIQQELLAGALEDTNPMPNLYIHGPRLETDVIEGKQDKKSAFLALEPSVPPPSFISKTSSAFIDSSASYLKNFDTQVHESLPKTHPNFSEMAVEPDILPITHLSIPTFPSSFHPQSTSQPDSHPLPAPVPKLSSTLQTTSVSLSGLHPSKALPIDVDQISLAQTVHFEQDGVKYAATWGSILRELSKMPLMRGLVNSHQRKERIVQGPEEIKRASRPAPVNPHLPLSMYVPLPPKEKTIPIAKGSGTPDPVTTTQHISIIPSSSMKVSDTTGEEIIQKSPSSSSPVGEKHQQKKCTKDALDLEIEELRNKKAKSKKEKKALKDSKMAGVASKKTGAKKASEKLGGVKDDVSSQMGELSHPELGKHASKVGQKVATKKSSIAYQLKKDKGKAIATSLPGSSSTPLPTSIEFLAPPSSSQTPFDIISTSIAEISELDEIDRDLSKEKVLRKEKRRHGDDEDLDESQEESYKRLKSGH